MLDAKVHKGCVQSYDAVANTIALCDCGGDGPCNWKDGKRVKPVNTGAPEIRANKGIAWLPKVAYDPR